MNQYAEYEAREKKALARGVCPYSGGNLRREVWDSHGPTMTCGWMCDCFGYDPDDPRLGTT